jgi:hypothetical protein
MLKVTHQNGFITVLGYKETADLLRIMNCESEYEFIDKEAAKFTKIKFEVIKEYPLH